MKDRETAAAKTEHDQITASFVAACRAIDPDTIDATCFETAEQEHKDDKDRRKHCRDSLRPVEGLMFRTGR